MIAVLYEEVVSVVKGSDLALAGPQWYRGRR